VFKDSDEEGLQRKLESRDGAERLVKILLDRLCCVGVRDVECLRQMSQRAVGTGCDWVLVILRCRAIAFRWRADRAQCGSDGGLGMVETVPNAVRSGVAHVGVEAFEGTSFVTGRGGVSEELPELSCAEEEPFDFVGEPNAEGSSTALVSSAVATEDAVGANGPASRILVLESLEESMSIERPDVLAVRAGRELEVEQ
jgi:hypothetical protein